MKRIHIKTSLINWIGLLLLFSCIAIGPVYNVHAEDEKLDSGDNSRIVVSIGDSFSAGESIEPYIDHNIKWSQKYKSQDWMSHRSEISWPGMLKIPGIEGQLSDAGNRDANWIFKAISGAETKHMKENFKKVAIRSKYDVHTLKIQKELDAFSSIPKGSVDYVTLTLGGNDVDFTDVVTKVVVCPGTLHKNAIDKKIEKLWEKFEKGTKKERPIKESLEQAYRDISEAAGEQATIIVAGYPHLFEKTGKGFPASAHEAECVNENISLFNERIEEIVDKCKKDGINIEFVSVEAAFDDHEAYSEIPYINPVIPGARMEDLDVTAVASAASMHPNEEGAKKYAEKVQERINELEEGKITFSVIDDEGNALNGVTISSKSDFSSEEKYNQTFVVTEELNEITVDAIGKTTITLEKEGYLSQTVEYLVFKGKNIVADEPIMMTKQSNHESDEVKDIWNYFAGTWETNGQQPYGIRYTFDEQYRYAYGCETLGNYYYSEKDPVSYQKTDYGYYVSVYTSRGVGGYRLYINDPDNLECIGDGDPHSSEGYSGTSSLHRISEGVQEEQAIKNEPETEVQQPSSECLTDDGRYFIYITQLTDGIIKYYEYTEGPPDHSFYKISDEKTGAYSGGGIFTFTRIDGRIQGGLVETSVNDFQNLLNTVSGLDGSNGMFALVQVENGNISVIEEKWVS